MKQRITYLLPEGSPNDPFDIHVESHSLEFSTSDLAAEEHRFTLGISDLPEEIQTILKDCHELHIKWTSSLNRPLPSPLVSRLPSGLHIFFTPRSSAHNTPLCSLIRALAREEEIKCDSVADTFIKPPISSERSATSPTYQYYTPTSQGQQIRDIFLSKLCHSRSQHGAAMDDCGRRLQELSSASYIDVDFDAISHAMTVTAFWSPTFSKSRTIRKLRAEDRIEVGVLEPQKATEREELSLGGYLTVLGQDDHPSTTLFSFPSRHHALPLSSQASFRASFQQPTGLHPKLEIKLQSQYMALPQDSCRLHAYWTIPSTLFIDRYQLSDPLFLASQNLVALRSLYGEQDLEAPEWVIEQWGSVALFQLATPKVQLAEIQPPPFDWAVTIPTHVRYLNGSRHDAGAADRVSSNVSWPILFWACEAEEGLKMSNNPFDRVNLGYDGLCGPKTMFYHIPPADDVFHTTSKIDVPVLNPEDARWVQLGTLVAVVAGFLWICWQLLRTSNLSSTAQDRKSKSQ